jgi:GABA permease
VLFVLAAHGDAPPVLVRLNTRRVPILSTLISSAAGFAGIVAATQAPQAVFDVLVSSTGALVVFVYIAIAMAQIRLRRERARRRPQTENQHVALPYLSIAVIATMVTVLVAMAFAPALRQELALSCLTLAITVLGYWVVRSTRVTAATRADF